MFGLLLAAAGALCGFVFPWRIDVECVFLRVPTLPISGTIQERTGEEVNILRSSRWLMIMVLEDCARRASLVKLGKIGEQPRQKVGILTSESRGLR